MALTVVDYLNKKNRWVEFPIVSISAIPNYVSGSKSLRIYFAFDDTDDNGKYAYPDYPEHLLNSRYRLGDVSYYSASIDPSWFNAVGDVITFEGGSFMRCNRVNVHGETRFGSNTKEKEIYFYSPNTTNYAAYAGNRCYVVTSVEKKENVTPLMTEAFYNLGGFLSVRMILKDWNDVLNAYKAWADGTSILTKAELSDKFNIRTNNTYTCVYSSELQNRFANTDSSGVGINSASSYRRGLPYDINKGDVLAKRVYNFLVGLGEGKMVVGDSGHGETSSGKDPSKPSGGDGNYDGSFDNDDLDKDTTKDLGDASVKAGLRTYIMGESSMQAFHDFMFADVFNNTWDSIRKSFGKPQDCIIGFNALYVPAPQVTTNSIKIGNIDTGIAGDVGTPASQWIEIDCGTVHIDEAWGSFLDYPPYTNANLYLPFCGTVDLPVNEIMNADITVTYNVDIVTGSCIASVYASRDKGDDLYSPSIKATIVRTQGNIGMQIPWSASDASRQWAAIGQIAAVATATAVSCGTATAAATTAVSATSTAASVAASHGIESEMYKTAAAARETAVSAAESAKSTFTKNLGTAGSTVLNNVGAIPYANVTRGGTAQNVFGVLQYFTPYLLITRPIQSYPENYRHYHGLPSNITTKLSELSGFTQVASIELDDIPGITPTEIDMLHEVLTTGFYL